MSRKPSYIVRSEFGRHGQLLLQVRRPYRGQWSKAGGGPMATWDQVSYAFYEEGTESGSTIIGTADTQQTLTVDTNYQLRIQVDETGGGSGDLRTIDFQYNHAGAGYVDVGAATTAVQYVDSTSLTNGADTTQRLDTGSFINTNAGVTEDNTIPNLTYGANEKCEFLLSFKIIGADVSDGDEILFRIQGCDSFTIIADADVSKPAAGGRRIFIIS